MLIEVGAAAICRLLYWRIFACNSLLIKQPSVRPINAPAQNRRLDVDVHDWRGERMSSELALRLILPALTNCATRASLTNRQQNRTIQTRQTLL